MIYGVPGMEPLDLYVLVKLLRFGSGCISTTLGLLARPCLSAVCYPDLGDGWVVGILEFSASISRSGS